MTATAEYTALLTELRPEVIRSEAAYRRALKRVERLMEHAHRSSAENKMLALLAALIEEYEDRHEPIGTATPLAVLRELMAARGMSIADLGRLLGSSGLASQICAGNRGFSKTHIAKLAAHFHVNPSVFFNAPSRAV